MFLHSIVEKVEEYSIIHFVNLNFDQTSIEICFCLLDNISGKNSRHICIIGDSDKYSLTATFTITFDSRFLGMPLIYSEKTDQSKFPEEFSLSVNAKEYTVETESRKFIKEILILYDEGEEKKLNLPKQKALVVFDVFKGQLTRNIIKLFGDTIIQPYIYLKCQDYNFKNMEIKRHIIQKGLSNLPTLYPFNDIDPIINIDTVSVVPNLESVVDKTTEEFKSMGVRMNNVMITRKGMRWNKIHLMFLMMVY